MLPNVQRCIYSVGCNFDQKPCVRLWREKFCPRLAEGRERKEWSGGRSVRGMDTSVRELAETRAELFSGCSHPHQSSVSASRHDRHIGKAARDSRLFFPSIFKSHGRAFAIIQCNWLCYSRLFGDCLFFFGRKSRKRSSSPSSPSETSALTEATPSSTRMSQPTPLLPHGAQKLERRGSQPMTLTSLGESLREAILSRRSVDISGEALPDKTAPHPGSHFGLVTAKKKVHLDRRAPARDKPEVRNEIGPMDTNEWRNRGQEMVEYIAQYLDTISERRVTPSIEPGYLKPLLPEVAPYKPEPWDQIMEDFEKYIMPGVTHWQHPRFHAYFPAGNSYPSILADMLTDAIGCIGFSWVSSHLRNFDRVKNIYRLQVPRVQN